MKLIIKKTHSLLVRKFFPKFLKNCKSSLEKMGKNLEVRPEKCIIAADIRPEKCERRLIIRPEKCDLNEKNTL